MKKQIDLLIAIIILNFSYLSYSQDFKEKITYQAIFKSNDFHDFCTYTGNNYGGQSLLGYPLVIEMTFARNPVPLSDQEPIFPNPLDMVNNARAQELNLNFTR